MINKIQSNNKVTFKAWINVSGNSNILSKKDLKKWREEAKSLPGDLNENTSRLYDEYLKKTYPGK